VLVEAEGVVGSAVLPAVSGAGPAEAGPADPEPAVTAEVAEPDPLTAVEDTGG
jgi:hypothetical protein